MAIAWEVPIPTACIGWLLSGSERTVVNTFTSSTDELPSSANLLYLLFLNDINIWMDDKFTAF